mmetsp:Transcript_7735/g.29003  ORF Transcript_7735/g.29003 Transcript_7735/m.29003 type:complete len:245 (-) Transcript_7735:2217-2951(-)|eukprot:CAMPEP_0117443824 /NCGR_PEP_ID=MMETSP0759-20121206/4909_1 /TAXON_ID=63605 /ORGANISM="Percolomonas cosmopolitus, Strain WS" /LENGTH=244 /DNA_ID=CAMNT_0005235841 /DNA_START=40 /DNA_END=774 /DNA_ORIENTATION=-
MATRLQFHNSHDIGVFSVLTNKYCIVGGGESTNFYSVFERELGDRIPVIYSSCNATKIVGSMIVGNKNGLLVPSTMTDQEMLHLRNSLPDDVIVQRVEERLSCLGNCIATNDHVALVHKEISQTTMEIIEDVLGVEAVKTSIGGNPLVGSYCVFSNAGGVVHPSTTTKEQDQLSNILQVPIVAGTVNRGSKLLGAGLVVNDWSAYVGAKTTSTEVAVIESIFNLKDNKPSKIVNEFRSSLIEDL